MIGGRIAVSYRSAVLVVAATTTDDDESIRSPFGSYPGYVSLMQSDFDRADEDAWMLALSYHFDRLGLQAVSAHAAYAEGHGARAADRALQTEREGNLTFDYRPDAGRLRGFWLRLRGSVLDATEGGNSNEIRVILNWDLPLL